MTDRPFAIDLLRLITDAATINMSLFYLHGPHKTGSPNKFFRVSWEIFAWP